VSSNSLISYTKKINILAQPILVSFISGYIFNIGDQAIIGRTSLEGYAAVGVVANLLYAITGTFGILSLTLNIVGSQMLGKNDKTGYGYIFNTSFTLCILIGIIFQIICILFGKSILEHLYNLEGLFLQYAYDYLVIAGLGVLLNFIIFILSAFFKSQEKTKVLMIASVIGNAVNLLIDYILVFGKFGFPQLGVKGAAIGTVIGLLLTVLIYLFTFRKHAFFRIHFSFHVESIYTIIKSYIPLIGQEIIESSGFMLIFTALLTKLGVIVTGSYNLVMVIINVLILPVYAFSSVTSTLVAKTDGPSKNADIINIIFAASLSSTIFLLFSGTIILSQSAFFCSLITDSPHLIEEASAIMILAIGIQFFNISNQILKSALNALSFEKWVMFYSSLIGVITLFSIYYSTQIFDLKLVGIFFSFGINFILLSAGFLFKITLSVKKKSLH